MSKWYKDRMNRGKDYFRDSNAEVHIGPNDNFEKKLREFNKQVEESMILEDVIRRLYYEKPSDKKRRKSAEAKYRKEKEKNGR